MSTKMQCGNYGEAGIIFVTIEDPYSRITRSISKCEYSAIGFYAPSMSTGILKIIVTLVDLFGVERPTWLNSGCTLDRLIGNPLVTRLAVKPLLSTSPHDLARFRACICRGTDMVGKPSFEDTIFSLFGYRRGEAETPVVTGIDFVNQVITLYGAMDKIQPGSSMSLTALEELRCSSNEDQLSVIGMMGLPFSNSGECIDISTYIVDTSLFSSLIDITLPSHHIQVIEEEKRKMLNLYRPYLIKGFSTFVELLLGNPDFFNTILERLREGRKFTQASEKILYDMLLCNSSTSEDLIAYLTGKEDALDLKEHLENEYYTSCLYLGRDPKTFPSPVRSEDPLKAWAKRLLTGMDNYEETGKAVKIDMKELASLVGYSTPTSQDSVPAFLVWEDKKKEEVYFFSNSGDIRSQLNGMSKEELIKLYKSLKGQEEYESLREAISEQLIT